MEQFNTGNAGKTVDNITNTSKEVLEGKLREIVSKMSVEEIFMDRETFAQQVQEIATKELADMGLEIKAFTIKKISDENDYLNSLGKRKVAEVKRDAAIAESNANKEKELAIATNARETAVRKAELDKETALQLATTGQQKEQARIEAETNIANAEKEKQLRILANQKETNTEKATADAAYEIQQNTMKKQIIETNMAANLIQEARNADLVSAQKKVELTKKESETVIAKQDALRAQEQLAATMQKTAEAEANKLRTQADAALYQTEKNAEAAKVKQIKEAEAAARQKELFTGADAQAKKIQADADAWAVEQKGVAEAKATEAVGEAKGKAISAEGLAEAEVIKQKGLAEAEAMKVKAEAYKQYGEAAVTQMIIDKLPEITKNMADAIVAPMSKIGAITIVDSGAGENQGANKITGYTANMLTQIPAMIKATTGIDVTSMLKNVAAGLTAENAGHSVDSETDE
jgi:flotillin